MPTLKPWSEFSETLRDVVDDSELINDVRDEYERALKTVGDKKLTENYLMNMGRKGGRIERFEDIESRINKLGPRSQLIARENYWKIIEPVLGKDVKRKNAIFDQIFPSEEEAVEAPIIDPIDIASTITPAGIGGLLLKGGRKAASASVKKGLGQGVRTRIEALKGKIGSVEELLETVTARSKLLGVKKPLKPTKLKINPSVINPAKPTKLPSAKPAVTKTKPEIPTLSDEAKTELERLLP